MTASKQVRILKTWIDCLTYKETLEKIQNWGGKEGCQSIALCNTHTVTLAREDPSFQNALDAMTLRLPDGMPLVWLANRQGADLKTRVYGPTLMDLALRTAAGPHHLLGGTKGTAVAIEGRYPKTRFGTHLFPDIQRDWDDAQKWAAEMEEGILWVALGGGVQERWIAETAEKMRRGTLIGVGHAFALLAGEDKFAPGWMQKTGLTWLHRLGRHPRKVGRRYLRYHPRFLYHLLMEGLNKNQRP